MGRLVSTVSTFVVLVVMSFVLMDVHRSAETDAVTLHLIKLLAFACAVAATLMAQFFWLECEVYAADRKGNDHTKLGGA